jgi:hypothetical protein
MVKTVTVNKSVKRIKSVERHKLQGIQLYRLHKFLENRNNSLCEQAILFQ